MFTRRVSALQSSTLVPSLKLATSFVSKCRIQVHGCLRQARVEKPTPRRRPEKRVETEAARCKTLHMGAIAPSWSIYGQNEGKEGKSRVRSGTILDGFRTLLDRIGRYWTLSGP
jgi:hypothetical protein